MRELTHDLCIFVGVINSGVDTIVYVTAVVIAVAECDIAYTSSPGHDAWYKISVIYIWKW